MPQGAPINTATWAETCVPAPTRAPRNAQTPAPGRSSRSPPSTSPPSAKGGLGSPDSDSADPEKRQGQLPSFRRGVWPFLPRTGARGGGSRLPTDNTRRYGHVAARKRFGSAALVGGIFATVPSRRDRLGGQGGGRSSRLAPTHLRLRSIACANAVHDCARPDQQLSASTHSNRRSAIGITHKCLAQSPASSITHNTNLLPAVRHPNPSPTGPSPRFPDLSPEIAVTLFAPRCFRDLRGAVSGGRPETVLGLAPSQAVAFGQVIFGNKIAVTELL